MSTAASDSTIASDSDVLSGDTDTLRQRHKPTPINTTGSTFIESDVPAISKPNVTQLNQGASRSSSHICSNIESCPLIAAFEALPHDQRDSLQLSENLYACSGCRSVMYCSLECQRLSWFADGGHKEKCGPMRMAWNEKHPEQAMMTEGNQTNTNTTADGKNSTTTAASATATATTTQANSNRRSIAINVNVGPRLIIALALILYLIYRFYGVNTDVQTQADS